MGACAAFLEVFKTWLLCDEIFAPVFFFFCVYLLWEFTEYDGTANTEQELVLLTVSCMILVLCVIFCVIYIVCVCARKRVCVCIVI